MIIFYYISSTKTPLGDDSARYRLLNMIIVVKWQDIFWKLDQYMGVNNDECIPTERKMFIFIKIEE